ncbi:hypothetical protein BKA64DRAFT_358129 [Cadophora sp. MPI-SDFR-AT-0126]|nr:hypothetical protein BKA64DRAFT_358129 [Leotiomycetes sp. MPI-SDFR-AT-0126]
MDSSNTAPVEFIWTVPSIPERFSHGDEGGSRSLPLSADVDGQFHPYDAFNVEGPHLANAFEGDLHRYPSPEDATMEEGNAMGAKNNQVREKMRQAPVVPRRARQGNIKWEAHKSELKTLYLDDGLSLKETMSIMNKKHGILESAKWYKEKFKSWGWQKNLPGRHALWMTQKAVKRKRDDDKETVFFYGGLQWDKADAEKTLSRTKKVRHEDEVISVDTPAEIHYETPMNVADSPMSALSPGAKRKGKQPEMGRAVSEISADRPLGNSDSVMSEHAPANGPALSWQGRSRTELKALFESARNQAASSDTQNTEEIFLAALHGYQKVLGPTHEETVKVTFAVATFYAELDRPTDADKIIDDITRTHMARFGCEDRRSLQLVLQIVELLNCWGRQNDALAILQHSKELAAAKSEAEASVLATKKRRTRGVNRRPQPDKFTSAVDLMGVAQEIIEENEPARLEYGIGIARTYVAAKDDSVEAFLLAIMKHCESDPDLEKEYLQANTELLRLYSEIGRNGQHESVFSTAFERAKTVIQTQKWNKKLFQSFEMMEVLLELSASILKGGFDTQAEILFKRIEDKADHDFDWDDERTIWTKISIGLVYQTHRSWALAKPWFDHAYAASFDANGEEDGITMALDLAREKRHFSYLSDEGRPFKTIFGVSGLTIRPNRLHLD